MLSFGALQSPDQPGRKVIDLHLHTTASDGRCTPEELVARALTVGIRALSVTDHDTRASEAAARSACRARGIEFIPGIEITAVHEGKDVHVLAYNLPGESAQLDSLISAQRQLRLDRAREIADKLARQGVPIDIDALIESAANGGSVARPQIARCLVASGHCASVLEAFDRYLGEHAPAYVQHEGASPTDVVELIVRSGGLSSLAHPSQKNGDGLIPVLVDAGLACVEAFHSSHDEWTQNHYVALASRYGLALTGGSDYHGEGTRRSEFFGRVGLPLAEYQRFLALIGEAP